MPSGFQQDSNQLSPGLYRVVWVANTGTYATADGNDNGAITPNSADSFTTLPTTLVKGKARARGNMRFRNVINRLTGLADCQILDIETGISGGGPEVAGDNQVTSLAFTVKYDRDEEIDTRLALQVSSPWAVSTAYVKGDVIFDSTANLYYVCITAHTSSGTLPISTNTDVAKWTAWSIATAIKDQFVRGFRDATTANARVYNGTAGTDNMLSITVAAPDTAADIWADTTVTLIDGTELNTVDSAAAAE
jgi:hypothetical protein